MVAALTMTIVLLTSPFDLVRAQGPVLTSLDEMEGDIAGRWRDMAGSAAATLEPDEEIVKDGEQSGRWDPGSGARHIYLAAPDMPTNWHAFGALEMWIHSGKATGAVFAIVVQSENPATEGEDYYRCLVPVDWEGWRFLHLEPRSFLPGRQPVGWRQVDTLRLAIAGWSDLKYVPGTVLRFDALRLAPPTIDPERRVLFEPDTDWCAWWPLNYAVAPAKTGRYVAEWLPGDEAREIANRSVPSDWSGSTHLNLWLHCEDTAGGTLVVRAISDRETTDDRDFYEAVTKTDWDGWRLLSLPLASFERRFEPVGWQSVGELQLALGWTGAPVNDARLCLDDIWLSTRAETEKSWIQRAGPSGQPPPGNVAPTMAAPPADPGGEAGTDSGQPDAELARLVREALEAKQAGDLELAFTKYVAVLLRDAKHVEAHWGLAWVLATKGEGEAALEHFRKVVEFSDNPQQVREAQAAIARLEAEGNR
jgi:hypothetical protein